MIIFIVYFIISNPESCFTFNFDRIFMRDVKEKITIEGYLHDKIYLRSRVKVPCFGKRTPPKGVRSISWDHSGKSLRDDDERYRVDGDGVLTINDVSLDDAGVSFCRTNTTRGAMNIKHVIEVVQIPSAILQIFLIYNIRYCNTEYELFAKQFIGFSLKGKICLRDECKINSIHGTCHYAEATYLQVKVLIVFPEVPDANCDVNCTRQRSRDLTMKVAEFVIMEGERLKLPKEQEGLSISNYDIRKDMVCDPGFEMKGSSANSLCIPCKPGQFFDRGYCVPCRYNQYSELYGAKECYPCGNYLVTSKRGANSKQACHVIESRFFILLLVILLPILFLIIFCCWCTKRCIKRTAIASGMPKSCSTCHRRKTVAKSKHFYTESSSEDGIKRKLPVNPVISNSRVLHSKYKKFSIPQVEKKSMKNQGYIPPPPPLPTESTMKRVARDFKVR